MKKRLLTGAMVSAAAAMAIAGAASAQEYKVGILQLVDDASLNQIEAAIEAELDAKSAEGEDQFIYEGNVYNGQADATTMNQMTSQMIADEVREHHRYERRAQHKCDFRPDVYRRSGY